MPTHVCPALPMAPNATASAAASMSASSATMTASLPPASTITGVSVSAHAAMTFLPVAVDPVNASLSTPLRHSAAPDGPNPVITCSTGCSGTASANVSAIHVPTPGECSLGLNTTVFPAARAYAIEPTGVRIG